MNRTQWFILIGTIFILLWDLYLLIDGGASATISYEVTKLSWYSPWMPFSWGFLMGHFFPTRMRKDVIK